MNLYIDFGGTSFKYCYDNSEVIVLESYSVDLVSFLDNEINTKKTIKNIAISFAGQVRDGTILNAQNIDLKELYIKQYLQDKYQINTIVENDLNSAAIYEYSRFNDIQSVAVFYIGTGFGCGIVIEGKTLYGNDSFAGEIGHIPYKKRDKVCQCGRDDCLELSVSGKTLRGIKLNEVDEETKQVFLDGLKYAFFTVLNILNPEVYVLGGSVILNNRWLLEFLEDEYKKSSFYQLRGELTMVITDSRYGNIEGLKILLGSKDGEI